MFAASMLTVSYWQLGGVSSVLAGERPATLPVVSKVPTLILGMDVSHGSPGQSDIPSIAAVSVYIYILSYLFCLYLIPMRYYSSTGYRCK